MKKSDILRAWKDEEYLQSLSPEQAAALPENPAGPINTELALQQAVGGSTEVWSSVPCTILSYLGVGCETFSPTCGCPGSTDYNSCQSWMGTTCGVDPSTGICYS
jgi:mersacidin/lichenicidin family type 2 lantibiotic